jgi:Flp pilus assembly protein CpaB
MKIPALVLVAAVAASAVPVSADNNVELLAGYRAVSLSVPSHQLAFIHPGDRVDVMTTFEAPMEDKKIEAVTATILQNVTVIDLNPAQGIIELELNPNEAQYAALFDSKDKLWITRRAKGDVEMHPMEMASARKLFR